ncbi:MAG: hypothetical protein JWM20_381 [Patescibacteria group bacterium]|nr:hypothetical protein [Patescibacteria group bacterium]
MSTTTPDNSRDPDQKAIVEEFLSQGKDPFDRTIVEQIFVERGGEKIYNKIILESESWYAMPNLWPLPSSQNHFVAICQRNIKTPFELEKEEWHGLMETVRTLTHDHSIRKGAFCMRFGVPEISGTTVTHLHGHLIKAVQKETVDFFVGPRDGMPSTPGFNQELREDVQFQNKFWNVRTSTDQRLVFKMEFKNEPLCDIWNLTPLEWEEFRTTVEGIAKKFQIGGGAICIRFDTLNGIDAWLLSPAKNEKFIFQIKN